jgi:hypothetical protein
MLPGYVSGLVAGQERAHQGIFVTRPHPTRQDLLYRLGYNFNQGLLEYDILLRGIAAASLACFCQFRENAYGRTGVLASGRAPDSMPVDIPLAPDDESYRSSSLDRLKTKTTLVLLVSAPPTNGPT